MKTKYDKWLHELQTELLLLDHVITEPLARLRHTLPLISGILNDIKKQVIEHGFESQEAEIHFFKQVKPQIYARQIYEADLYAITSNCPEGTTEMRRAYYEQELQYIFRLHRIHAFHYQYYKTSASILDAQYFMRDGKPTDIPVLENIDPMPGFSTPLDYLFAKFIAAERMQEYLLDQLSNTARLSARAKNGPMLRWTGEAINLVEIAYGIWLTGQLNEGSATITDIILWLEEKLAVKIGVPNARWAQISARTHSSPTKFLDRMRDAIKERVDQEYGKRDSKRKIKRL
jgi:hypothetical protein